MNWRYSSSESNAPARHASAPPSAVVRFFTAWNEKAVKSATDPEGRPRYVAPNEWAASARTMTRSKARCSSVAGFQRSRTASSAANRRS